MIMLASIQHSVLNLISLVGSFIQKKALVGAFYVILKRRR